MKEKERRGWVEGEWADGFLSLTSNFWWSCRPDPLSVLADSTVKWKESELSREQGDLSLSQTQSHAGGCSAWPCHCVSLHSKEEVAEPTTVSQTEKELYQR